MKKIIIGAILVFLIAFIIVSVFWKADLRSAEIKNNTQSSAQMHFAKELLDNTIIKHGLDRMDQYATYEVTASDNWKGSMGKMGNPWGWNKDKMQMRFTVGDFDSQITVLEGPSKGFVAGIQSWDYYEKVNGEYKSEVDDNAKIIFTASAYHYFFELGTRLAKAPFVRYAGKDKLKGKDVDKLFVSWGNYNTKNYDQYILWIGKESGLIEATTFTTRDNPMPAPAFLYGSLLFDDYRAINGIMIPFTHTAQLMDPKDDIDDFIHQLTLDKFVFNSFEAKEIRPLDISLSIGDDKSTQ